MEHEREDYAELELELDRGREYSLVPVTIFLIVMSLPATFAIIEYLCRTAR
jgi:hypothetical protein